jgi:hypothetical protein
MYIYIYIYIYISGETSELVTSVPEAGATVVVFNLPGTLAKYNNSTGRVEKTEWDEFVPVY